MGTITRITKAKLTAKGTLETTYIDADGNEITLKGEQPCSEDLNNAFRRLTPYFADLTEQKEADLIVWDEIDTPFQKSLLGNIDVNSVSIGLKNGVHNVMMSGTRRLEFVKGVINLNTPKMDLDITTNHWSFVAPFERALNALLANVERYIEYSKARTAVVEAAIERNDFAAKVSEEIAGEIGEPEDEIDELPPVE